MYFLTHANAPTIVIGENDNRVGRKRNGSNAWMREKKKDFQLILLITNGTVILYQCFARRYIQTVARKDPGHSAKNAGGRLHLNTHTALTQRSRSELTMPLSRHSNGNLFGNEHTRNLSGNIRPQCSQLAEPLWTDSGVKEWN